MTLPYVDVEFEDVSAFIVRSGRVQLIGKGLHVGAALSAAWLSICRVELLFTLGLRKAARKPPPPFSIRGMWLVISPCRNLEASLP